MPCMSRPLRVEIAGAVYHFTSRGDRSGLRMTDITAALGLSVSHISRLIAREDSGAGVAKGKT